MGSFRLKATRISAELPTPNFQLAMAFLDGVGS
jgi:hypothetical protein